MAHSVVRDIRTDVSSRIRDCRVSPSFLVFALVKLPRQLASDTDEKRRKKKRTESWAIAQ